MTNLRLIKLLNYIKKHGSCTVAELRETFGVSHATIHRDIAALAAKGGIRRVRGGVTAIPEKEMPDAEQSIYSHYQDRLDRSKDAKTAVACKAVKYIEDGDIIFLDSSTTVYYLAKELQKTNFSNLTIITNSLLIMQEFPLFPTGYFPVALGGNYDVQLNAFLGAATLADLERLRIGKAFISALGATKDGFFSRHENHSYFLHRVLEIAGEAHLLLTADKFGKSGLFEIAPLSALTHITADAELPEYARSYNCAVLQKNGVSQN